ncbi:268_t:CDS:2, partial [Funneliformis mosseae]
EDEKSRNLKDIIHKNNDDNPISYNLYLRKSSNPDWRYLKNDKGHLEFGRVINQDEIKKAEKQAAQDYAKLGISYEISERSSSETNLSYHCTQYERASLEFSKYLKPRKEFIDAVKDALNSKDVNKLKLIPEEYGQLYSTEVIFGGKVYIKESKVSKKLSNKNSNKVEAKLNAGTVVAKVGLACQDLNGNADCLQSDRLKLIGGKVPDNTKFDEDSWYKSLSDYGNWDCVGFQNPA